MKIKNGYFYSDDPALLDRLGEELTYAGRSWKRFRGGIVQFALPKRIPKKDSREMVNSGKKKEKRPEQKSKRERWMNGV